MELQDFSKNYLGISILGIFLISIFFVLPSVGVSHVILILDLNDSDRIILSF